MNHNEGVVSIITVSKNSEQTISSTIESVISQTYGHIEYIIIDGNSKDNTNAIVDGYKRLIEGKGYTFLHIIEDDDGVYDAMNKGISRATGEWVFFLNSDDRMASDDVLEKVFDYPAIDTVDCIYGNTINVIDGVKFRRKGLPMRVIYYRMPFVHQALLVKRSVIVKYEFNTKWHILADFDQFLRMYLNDEKFKYVNIDVAEFSLSGISQKNNIKIAIEREKIQHENHVNRKCFIRRWSRNLAVIFIKGNFSLYKRYALIKQWFNSF